MPAFRNAIVLASLVSGCLAPVLPSSDEPSRFLYDIHELPSTDVVGSIEWISSRGTVSTIDRLGRPVDGVENLMRYRSERFGDVDVVEVREVSSSNTVLTLAGCSDVVTCSSGRIEWHAPGVAFFLFGSATAAVPDPRQFEIESVGRGLDSLRPRAAGDVIDFCNALEDPVLVDSRNGIVTECVSDGIAFRLHGDARAVLAPMAASQEAAEISPRTSVLPPDAGAPLVRGGLSLAQVHDVGLARTILGSFLSENPDAFIEDAGLSSRTSDAGVAGVVTRTAETYKVVYDAEMRGLDLLVTVSREYANGREVRTAIDAVATEHSGRGPHPPLQDSMAGMQTSLTHITGRLPGFATRETRLVAVERSAEIGYAYVGVSTSGAIVLVDSASGALLEATVPQSEFATYVRPR